jgi:pimeloyl-ACP methyl ester carboxylesterase
MRSTISPGGFKVSFETYGAGPSLVLVHGAFSDHRTNWEFVKPMLEEAFTVHAVARRGRGETDATEAHDLEDEARDLVAVLEAIAEPVFLLGHSYGAHTALAAAVRAPHRVRRLALYEPAWPRIIQGEALARLEALAKGGRWAELAATFFRDTLGVPAAEVDGLRATPLWPPIVADAPASLRDLQALSRYEFDPARFRDLRVPVLLQVGSESLRGLYVTDALAGVLPDVRVEALPGQAHEGMTTAPCMYAAAVTRFFLSARSTRERTIAAA